MRTRTAWLIAILPGALLLACTATRLATLQSDFNDLNRAKATCVPGSPPDGSPPCEGEQDVALYELALSAEKAAGQASDPRTKITLLRLAGVSAWQGRGPEAAVLVNKVSFEGIKECDSLEKRVAKRETWGVPRDCAVLVILPALQAHEVLIDRLEVLAAAKKCSAGDIVFSEIVDSYANETVLHVHRQQGVALGYQGVSESVRAYVAEAKRRMMCDLHTRVADFATSACREQGERVLREKDRVEQETETTFLEACG